MGGRGARGVVCKETLPEFGGFLTRVVLFRSKLLLHRREGGMAMYWGPKS